MDQNQPKASDWLESEGIPPMKTDSRIAPVEGDISYGLIAPYNFSENHPKLMRG